MLFVPLSDSPICAYFCRVFGAWLRETSSDLLGAVQISTALPSTNNRHLRQLLTHDRWLVSPLSEPLQVHKLTSVRRHEKSPTLLSSLQSTYTDLTQPNYSIQSYVLCPAPAV